MNLFFQKNAKFSSAGGSAPRPQWLRRLGALPPDPHWSPAAGGSAPQTPQTAPPHCEFLVTLLDSAKSFIVAQSRRCLLSKTI